MVSLKKKSDSSLKPIIKANGESTINEAETLTELLSAYFPHDTSEDETPAQQELRQQMISPPDTEEDPPFTPTEVSYSIQSMNSKKAPGHDQLTADIIKEAAAVLLTEITTLFNLCLKHQKFPDTFKKSIVRFIPKPNAQSINSPKAFPPICLLPVLGKALESLMINRITWSFKQSGALSAHQYGFTPQVSTTDAVLNTVNFLREAKAENLHAAAISLDVDGAFNNMWWPCLFQELKTIGAPKTYSAYR
jgi:hypothetical protein